MSVYKGLRRESKGGTKIEPYRGLTLEGRNMERNGGKDRKECLR